MNPALRRSGMWWRSLFCSAVGICLVLSGQAQAAVIYDTGGFEQPTYSVGALVGQDSWLGSGPIGDDPVLQSSVVHGGSPAAGGLRQGADLSTSIMAYRDFTPGTHTVTLATAIRIEDMAASGGYLDAVTIYKDYFGGGGNRATILYFQDDGDITVFDGGTERTVSSWVDDTWYNVSFTFDVPNQKFDLSINGTPVASDYSFLDGGATAMDLLLQLQADQLQVPVRRPVVQETTALGAAYLAGLAEGVWSSTTDIEANWALDAEFTPQAERAEADRAHARWLQALERSRAWATI